jgi:hypothetical protein
VINALKALLNRPIVHKRRRLAFALAATLLAGAALVPVLADYFRDDDHTQSTARPVQRRPHPSAPPAKPPTRTDREVRVAAAQADARALAQRFLPAYLAYTYGRADAKALRQLVHPSLWLDLAAHPPHVPSRTRELHPRVSDLRITATRASAISLEARVDDGQRRYAIALVAHPTAGRWQVVWIGS